MAERLDSQLNTRRVSVRNVPSENALDLSLRFGNSTSTPGIKPKVFNFHRLKDETVGKTLERMAQNLSSKIVHRQHKKAYKKLKKESNGEQASSGETPDAEISVSLQSIVAPTIQLCLKKEETMIPPEIPNVLAWNDGSTLVVDEEEYQVVVNPPAIVNGKITSHILPEFPIDYTLDFEFSEEDDALFVWLKHAIGVKRAGEDIPVRME